MSKIDKLGIRGIRSFSPAVQESMQFNTPLTLIVGYNGSGKTTIIETLKYATTGEQPPNSKGGAFIHDPKLRGEREVLAQVKLSFLSTVGQKLVVTRSLQLTTKKTQRVMKTLDGSLVIYNNGERTGLSTKVAELDELVPNYLGVSPAILDAVIFCHQDESLWPMSEPAALKKKFDEIFEAMKYTKAIDNLKVVRKKQGEELQKLKILEVGSKDAKEKGQRAEKQLAALQTQIEDLREQGEDLTRQMDDVQAQSKQKREEANSFFGIVQELKSKQDQYEVRSETINELKDSIAKMRTESDEWLEDHLQQYKGSLGRLQEEKKAKEAEQREMQGALGRARTALGIKQAEQGKLQSDKEKYERQVQMRAQMVREAAMRHELRGYDMEELGEEQVREFLVRIQKVWQDKRREVEQVQHDNARALEEATAVMTDLEARKAARAQERVAAKRRIAAIDERLAVLQQDMKKVDADEGTLALLEAAFGEVEARLAKATEVMQTAATDGQVEQEKEQIWTLERESQRLTDELVACTRWASERAEMELRRKEAGERRRRLETLTSAWQERLTSVLGAEWQTSGAEAAYQQVVQERAAAVKQARKSVDARQQELKQLEYRLSTMRERQRKMAAEAERCEKAVVGEMQAVRTARVEGGGEGEGESGVISVEDYQEELDNTEAELLTTEKDISLFDHLKDYYSKSQKVLNRFNKCSLCDRSFAEHPRERSRLLEKISKNLDDQQKRELEQERDALEVSLGRLRAVREQHDTLRRLRGEEPGLAAEVAAATTQREVLVRRLEDEDGALRDAETQQADVEAVGKTVSSMAQAEREVAEAERQLAKLEKHEQTQRPDQVADSVETIQERQAQCGEQLWAAQERLTKATAARQRQREVVSGLELERSELRNRIAEAQRQAERLKEMETQVQRLRTETTQQRATMEAADEALAVLAGEMAKARAVRQETAAAGTARERAGAAARDGVGETVHGLRMVAKEMAEYETEGGGAARLAATAADVATLEETIAETEAAVATAVARVRELMGEMDNRDREKKNIADNLSYRRNARVLSELRTAIAALEGRRAEDDYDRLVGEARRLEVQHSRLLAERSAIWGSMRSKDDELLRLLDEYEQEYRDAGAQYREAHIRVETTRAAIEDLGQYAAALDKAIMAYHARKMAEVNRVAGELWRATYQGTDIDTIMIRSDNESATGRRSYNYRVCMVKQDTEMDMRGRCSAGQKVLASIVIRLALAESFGLSCGLIALDEPTTNLDADNIRALAQSLHAIIRARQAQANFQLIVITHDEQFLRHMQCSDFCDTFYRVSRDHKQNSVITRENITRLIDG